MENRFNSKELRWLAALAWGAAQSDRDDLELIKSGSCPISSRHPLPTFNMRIRNPDATQETIDCKLDISHRLNQWALENEIKKRF